MMAPSYTVMLPMDRPMDAMSVADGAHIATAAFQTSQDYTGKWDLVLTRIPYWITSPK